MVADIKTAEPGNDNCCETFTKKGKRVNLRFLFYSMQIMVQCLETIIQKCADEVPYNDLHETLNPSPLSQCHQLRPNLHPLLQHRSGLRDWVR